MRRRRRAWRNAVAFAGFSGATFTNASNAAAHLRRFKPFDERVKNKAAGGRDHQRAAHGRLPRSRRRSSSPSRRRRCPASATAAASSARCRSATAAVRRTSCGRDRRADRRRAQGAGSPRCSRRSAASSPQVFVEIDRTKAQKLAFRSPASSRRIADQFGSAYVNDFNPFGRIYQVTAQADQRFRKETSDLARLRTRNAAGDMVPLGTLVDFRDVSGPIASRATTCTRCPNFRATPTPGELDHGASTR